LQIDFGNLLTSHPICGTLLFASNKKHVNLESITMFASAKYPSATHTGASPQATKPLPFFQAKLTVNTPGDAHEREADAVADQVMRMKTGDAPIIQRMPLTPISAVQRACANCEKEKEGVQRKETGGGDASGKAAPSIVSDVLSSSGGHQMDGSTRQFMESRFGQDFSQVRIHTDSRAAESASAIQARAYTSGRHVVFGSGEYQPSSEGGQRLLAHELVHVGQQSQHSGKILQRTPKVKNQAEILPLVKAGKWCRDTADSGKLHPPDQQCYREIPSREGYPSGNQFCFNKKSGEFIEESPDHVSAVYGQNEDGTCKIYMGKNPFRYLFTHEGRRSLGHAAADICPEDADLCGGAYGALSGLISGIGLAEHDLKAPGAGSLLIPLGMGALSHWLFKRGMPVINRFALRHGFLPSYNLGIGTSSSNFRIGAGMGFEQGNRSLPHVPAYLTFGLESTLGLSEESGSRSTVIAKIGLRIAPHLDMRSPSGRHYGSLYALGSVGAGMSLGKDDISAITSVELGAGLRVTDFMDVQLTGVKNDGDRDTTFMLKLNLVAPPRVLKGHRKK
jgi:hypothetical protein